MKRQAGVDREKLNRFWLLRDWSSEGANTRELVFVMLNPSIADAKVDDPTVRKCVGFAQRLGYGRMYVVNLFSLRATDPSALRDGQGHGPKNMVEVYARLEVADAVVFAWGASIMQAPEAARVRALSSLAEHVRKLKVEPLCLGVAKAGHPRHPLMVPYVTMPEVWAGYDTPEWGFLREHVCK